jgi:EmrB/QacA subfamily drug resistance transporter
MIVFKSKTECVSMDHNQIKRIIPWLMASVFFIEVLDESIISTSIPRMAASLHLNPLALKAAIISYLISLAVLIPTSGWIAGRFGVRRVLTTAVGIFMLGSLCCGLSSNLDELVLSRVLQGIGGAMMTPLGRMTMLHTFKKHELVRAMNFVIIPGLVGGMSGPVVGGLIVTYFSWRMIFFINIPFCLIAMLMVSRYVPDIKIKQSPAFDWVGFVLLGCGLGGITYAMEGLGQHFLPLWISLSICAVSLFSIFICYRYSLDRPHSIIEVTLFKIQTFRIAFITGVLNRLSITCVFFLLPLLYQINFGWLPVWSGLMMTPIIIGSISAKSISHHVLNTLGVRRLLLIDSIIMGLIIMSNAFIDVTTPASLMVMLNFALGASMSLFFTAGNGMAYAELEQMQKMQGVSIFSTIQRVTTGLGVGVTALVLTIFLSGDMLTNSSPVSAFHYTFLVMGIFCFISVGFFFLLPHNAGAVLSSKTH